MSSKSKSPVFLPPLIISSIQKKSNKIPISLNNNNIDYISNNSNQKKVSSRYSLLSQESGCKNVDERKKFSLRRFSSILNSPSSSRSQSSSSSSFYSPSVSPSLSTSPSSCPSVPSFSSIPSSLFTSSSSSSSSSQSPLSASSTSSASSPSLSSSSSTSSASSPSPSSSSSTSSSSSQSSSSSSSSFFSSSSPPSSASFSSSSLSASHFSSSSPSSSSSSPISSSSSSSSFLSSSSSSSPFSNPLSTSSYSYISSSSSTSHPSCTVGLHAVAEWRAQQEEIARRVKAARQEGEAAVARMSEAAREMVERLVEEKRTEREGGRCPICYDGLRAAAVAHAFYTPPLAKLQCGHMYHYDCLIEWFKKEETCPLCRGRICRVEKYSSVDMSLLARVIWKKIKTIRK